MKAKILDECGTFEEKVYSKVCNAKLVFIDQPFYLRKKVVLYRIECSSQLHQTK